MARKYSSVSESEMKIVEDQLCLYCMSDLTQFSNKVKHLKIHKTLKHQMLPVSYDRVTFANSSLPIIDKFFRVDTEVPQTKF